MHEWIYDGVSIGIVIMVLSYLFQQRIRTSPVWRATVTPLASIIGSGFLVSAPLLLLTVGAWASLAMMAIVLMAYGIGESMRFNIRYVEDVVENQGKTALIFKIDALSRPALAIAYVISITFYLKLLSAFALHDIADASLFYENCLTTSILVLIGLVGKFRGLRMLEVLETYSVNTKLSIIAALIFTFLMYNVEQLASGQWHNGLVHNDSLWSAFCKVLGMVIIIQGFETSRYIGEAYNKKIRIKTMRNAQILSGFIYIVFVALATIIIKNIHHVSETSIIELSGVVASILPIMLVVAAIFSQFSAAISDTLGAGGLFVEAANKKISSNFCYLLISIFAIILTWLTSIYSIITIASKAFAIYYAMQVLITLLMLGNNKKIKRRWLKIYFYFALLFISIIVVIFGAPIS